VAGGILRKLQGCVDGDAQRRPACDIQWQVGADVDAGEGDDGHDGQDDGTPSCAHARQGRGAQRGRHTRVPGQVAKPGRFRAAAAGGGQQRSSPRRVPGTSVMDQATYKAERVKPVQQELALVYTLLALAILIALLGIGNTLALSIFERTRELGVLRAVGMTRSQLRASIRWESVVMALQGTVLGPAHRRVLRLGPGAVHEEPGDHRVQHPRAEPHRRGGAGRAGRSRRGDPAQQAGSQAEHPACHRQRLAHLQYRQRHTAPPASSGTGVTAGTVPSAQPLLVRRGATRAQFDVTWQSLSEHDRGGGLEFAVQLAGGADCLKPQ
jgi:hypothetical protein